MKSEVHRQGGYSIIGNVIIIVGILLTLVYWQMSKALLEKSEALIHSTTEQTIQETRAWINKILAAMEIERDTIEYANMDGQVLQEYIRHIIHRYLRKVVPGILRRLYICSASA